MGVESTFSGLAEKDPQIEPGTGLGRNTASSSSSMFARLEPTEVGSVVDDSLLDLGTGLGTRGPLLGCNTAEVEKTKGDITAGFDMYLRKSSSSLWASTGAGDFLFLKNVHF